MVPGIVRRIATQVAPAQEAGAEVILFTCSLTSPAVDAVRPLIDVPIIKIDDAVAVRAIETGPRIGSCAPARPRSAPARDLSATMRRRGGAK